MESNTAFKKGDWVRTNQKFADDLLSQRVFKGIVSHVGSTLVFVRTTYKEIEKIDPTWLEKCERMSPVILHTKSYPTDKSCRRKV